MQSFDISSYCLQTLFGWLFQQGSCGSHTFAMCNSGVCEELAGEAHHEDQCFYI